MGLFCKSEIMCFDTVPRIRTEFGRVEKMGKGRGKRIERRKGEDRENEQPQILLLRLRHKLGYT